MSLSLILALLIGAPLCIFFLTALLNIPFYLRLRSQTPASAETTPRVSILVPARNEAVNIGRTISHLLQQTYPNYELIVLDDNSTDGTAELARQAAEDAKQAERLRIIAGTPLPAGWLGKNWACQQLGEAASGNILVFTDADVTWQPQALAALVAQMQQHSADMGTVWPTQQTETWGERLTVPLLALAILGYLPIVGVHYLPFAAFAAANGQCLAFRRAAYDGIGRHQSVRDNIVEDVALARRTKQHRFKLRMFDGNHLIGCRMYHSWDEVREGFAKNMLAGHGNSLTFLAVSTLVHWLMFIAPIGWLIFNALMGHALWLPLALMFAGILLRALTAQLTRQRILDSLLMPVSTLLMTRIAWQSVMWQRQGKRQWKGRIV